MIELYYLHRGFLADKQSPAHQFNDEPTSCKEHHTVLLSEEEMINGPAFYTNIVHIILYNIIIHIYTFL